MDIKNFSTGIILQWFKEHRQDLNVNEDWCIDFYESIKDQILLVKKENDREAVSLLITVLLETYFSEKVIQDIYEVIHEKEFLPITEKLKKLGYPYSIEVENLIEKVKSSEWYKNNNYSNREEIKEKIRFIVESYWYSLL